MICYRRNKMSDIMSSLHDGMSIDPQPDDIRYYEVDETANLFVVGLQFTIGKEGDEGILGEPMDAVKCPFCKGVFAVESNYLDNVDEHVHCPICCMEVRIGLEE
jgi:hypothetical protein